MKNNEYSICIVDNHSPNDSYNKCIEHYQNDEKVMVVQTSDNMGYAKGANFGVKELDKHFYADYICVLNNDILFYVDDLAQHIEEIKQPFDVLAPNILRQSDLMAQNPQPQINYSLFWINIYIFFYHVLAILHKLRLDLIPYIMAVTVMGKVYSKKKNNQYLNQYIQKAHGSCIIFTHQFIEEYHSEVLNPSTFLFLEEDFLSLRCTMDQKKIYYDASIQIVHLEDHSMDSLFRSVRKKRSFVYKNHLQSFKAFKQYYLTYQLIQTEQHEALLPRNVEI